MPKPVPFGAGWALRIFPACEHLCREIVEPSIQVFDGPDIRPERPRQT